MYNFCFFSGPSITQPSSLQQTLAASKSPEVASPVTTTPTIPLSSGLTDEEGMIKLNILVFSAVTCNFVKIKTFLFVLQIKKMGH